MSYTVASTVLCHTVASTFEGDIHIWTLQFVNLIIIEED